MGKEIRIQKNTLLFCPYCDNLLLIKIHKRRVIK
jgi:DNA-directed RNA polymerase subunit RPC12/RpoP